MVEAVAGSMLAEVRALHCSAGSERLDYLICAQCGCRGSGDGGEASGLQEAAVVRAVNKEVKCREASSLAERRPWQG